MKIMKTLLSVAVLSALTNSAIAGGTAAGVDINNTATINYSVSGTAEAPIESAPGAGNSTAGSGNGTPTVFKVDKKIDLTVTAGSGVTVAPNTIGSAITFTVQNTGNSDEDFTLTQTHVTGGGDDFDATACTITSPASPVNIAVDATQTVTVSCNIPSSVNNTETSKIDLKATAVDGTGTPYVESGTEAAGTVDVVLADGSGSATDTGAETVPADAAAGNGNRNASHSAVNTYTVAGAAANLNVKKTSTVISDPYNNGTNPKRIPGAIVEYVITVSNADGATDATHLVISDPLQGDLSYISCNLAGDAVVNTVAPSPALGCSESGGTVSSSSFTLPGGTGGTAKVATLTIRASVN